MPQTPPKPRDLRLDFFRGVALFIIFLAHAPGNVWAQYIPARFGPSDAADMFVFLSGCAAAIAFGGAYRRHGWAVGTMRISLRVWQLYLAHIILFFFIAAVCVALTKIATSGVDYTIRLNLVRLFHAEPGSGDPQQAVLDLFTLQWVPNYFDILPIYLIVLAMVPIAMLIARIHPLAVIGTSVFLWWLTWNQGLVIGFGDWKLVDIPLPLDLLADRTIDRMWFFNPFAWQLLFFLGFSFLAGWIKPPPRSRLLFWACVAFVILMVPIRQPGWVDGIPAAAGLYDWLRWWAFKPELGPLRPLQLLAMGYVALYLLENRRHWLATPWAAPIVKCGQQSLSVFVTSMVLSWIAGAAFDHIGNGAGALILVNGTGFALLIGVAYLVAAYKRQPWKRQAPTALPPEGRPVEADPTARLSAADRTDTPPPGDRRSRPQPAE